MKKIMLAATAVLLTIGSVVFAGNHQSGKAAKADTCCNGGACCKPGSSCCK